MTDIAIDRVKHRRIRRIAVDANHLRLRHAIADEIGKVRDARTRIDDAEPRIVRLRFCKFEHALGDIRILPATAPELEGILSPMPAVLRKRLPMRREKLAIKIGVPAI